ncbi:type II toxin-antitoxin system RelE/ParE family toxin [Achromobacter piechaudii]|uniref:Addiction module killer protein n=1 Tax=Achromobacter piechaudii TaxID=72556 RepID=A0ABM8KTU7_9BURK|nr:type II toxin-antitoxin system RelE/ParE family toxin [Achromobacter piechaudii]CAB3675406.1 hypothetical protein LMG1873_01346 [Achromobacter piechaudii]CAB3840172.1 hypothetical protein LMG2828_01437 [Achromobacter piechaudii]CAB3942419.1 hypothetical protein LMG6103_00357 [Achromobacter piechaudii]
MFEIEHYVTADTGTDLYVAWLKSLRDNRARVAIIRRVFRIEQGNFGDHKPCRAGVWELRINVGPGYRVYYGLAGRRVELLLSGGDKRSQAEDIERAVRYWQHWNQEQP